MNRSISSFNDDPVFDPNSTPQVKYPKKTVTVAPTTTTTVTTKELSTPEMKECPESEKCSKPCSKPACRNNRAPWPTIFISIIGIGLLMYTAIGFNIPQDRRIFGIVMILLWSLLWSIILWVLWRECHVSTSWWLLILGVGVLILFFVIVIALNLGN